MSRKQRFFNMYLTTTISVSLVLLLIGFLCVLLITSQTMVNRIKEDTCLTLVLEAETDSSTISRCDRMLETAPYCKTHRYISREEALEEHITMLGEDPTRFLGYNPLRATFELHPTAEFCHPDSIANIEAELSALPYIERVLYQVDMLRGMNRSFVTLAWGMLGITGLLLLIALALLVNTIRLQIYSKRFIIRTMSLVGATSWMIRRPFLRKNLTIGLCASALAICILGISMYYVQFHLGILLFEPTCLNVGIIAGVIFFFGIFMTGLAAIFTTGRYLRMDADTLYRI